MLSKEVTEQRTTGWTVPILFALKKDGSLHFWANDQKLNAVSIRDSYPLPRMCECIDSLGESTVFSTVDASPEYC